MHLLNRLRDRIEFTAAGGDRERLLNALTRAGIAFGGTHMGEETLRVTVPRRRAAEAERLLRRCGCETLGRRELGAGRFTRRALRRRVLLVSLMLCLCALAASSLFVWDIEVEGTETLSASQVQAALARCGVEIGSFWPGCDLDRIRAGMLLELPELSWMTVNLSGSSARVIVRERMAAPEVLDNTAAVDLAAAYSGVVTRVLALEGEQLVQPGQTVLAGDILLASARDTVTGARRYVRARGSVQARIWHSLTAQAPLVQTEKQSTGGQSRYVCLCLARKEIKLWGNSGFFAPDCDRITQVHTLAVPGLFVMPLALEIVTLRPYTVYSGAADAAAVQAGLEALLTRQLETRIGADGEIVSAVFQAQTADELLTVTLEAECLQEIGTEQPAIPEEEDPDHGETDHH